jgi:hypothetical protein
MGFVAVFSLVCMVLGSWHFSCFTGGMLLADHNPHQEVSNTQPTRHSILCALLFGVAFYIAGLPTFSLSDAHLRPVPGSETVRWLTLVATRRPSALHVVTIRNLSFALNLLAPTLERNIRDELLSIPRQNLLLSLLNTPVLHRSFLD